MVATTVRLLKGAVLILALLQAGMLQATAQQMQSAAVPAQGPSVLETRVGIHPDKTRFVVEMTEAAAYRVVLRTLPDRVEVTFPRLQATIPASHRRGSGMVTSVVSQRIGSTGVLFRVTLNRPAAVREAFVIPPRDGRMTRFVLDLVPTSLAMFRSKANQVVAAWPGQSALATAADPAVGDRPVVVAVPTPAPRPAVRPGRVLARPMFPLPRRRPTPPTQRLIVLDPGHGGVDPGAISVNGVYEKHVVLAMARQLRDALLATGRYRVRLTRTRDVFLRLRERVAIAREAEADLFVSLHADSIGSDDVRGVSVYTLSDRASDREAEMLAAKENRADVLGGLDLSAETDIVASILIDLAQRDTMNQSRRFASLAVREFGRVVTLLPRPQRAAGFAVLTAPDVPSVLIELGYLSSPQEANLLTTPGHRQKLAGALVRSIDTYFQWLIASRPT